MDKERLNRIRLINTVGIGSVTFYNLLARFTSASEAVEALPRITARHKNPKRPISISQATKIIDTAEKNDVKILVYGDDHFPKIFDTHITLPPLLYAKGQTQLLNKPCISIVGARNASPISIRYAYRMSHDLSKNALAIVSGMARGIDTAAHEGALNQATIAVMAGCVTIPYPKENQDLYNNICHQGCIISESPMGTTQTPNLFAIRNRIIAGLSLGTLVVEAEIKSGSLITAHMASDMGREVFAIPGSPANGRARGCNQLIKDGATLVETPDDILECLRTFEGNTLKSPIFTPEDFIPDINPQDAEKIGTDITALLADHPMDIDSLIRITHIPANLVRTTLLELELSGTIHINASGLIVLQ